MSWAFQFGLIDTQILRDSGSWDNFLCINLHLIAEDVHDLRPHSLAGGRLASYCRRRKISEVHREHHPGQLASSCNGKSPGSPVLEVTQHHARASQQDEPDYSDWDQGACTCPSQAKVGLGGEKEEQLRPQWETQCLKRGKDSFALETAAAWEIEAQSGWLFLPIWIA